MYKHYLVIALLLITPKLLSAQIDTFFNLNRATGHFIKDDTIWLAAKSGVVKRLCSTGTTLATYTPKNAPITIDRVSYVYVDQRHRMWIFLDDQGVAMLDGNHWTFWSVDDAHYVIAGGYNGKIAVDAQGIPWIGAGYRTPMYYKNGQWRQPPDTNNVTIDPRELKIGPDGKVWAVNGYGGIYRYTGISWELVVDRQIPVVDFALDQTGGFYTCTFADSVSKVYHYAAGSLDSVLVGIINGRATHIAVAPSGKIWVAGEFVAGIAYLEGTQWKYLVEDGEIYPVYARHLALSVDAQGRLWDSKTLYGTKMYDGTQWQRIWTGPIGQEQVIASQDGSFWFGYLNTLSHYFPATGQTEYVYLDPQRLFANNMVGLEGGPDNTFYAATQHGQLAWYDGHGNFKKSIQSFSNSYAWDSYVFMTVDQSNNLYYKGWDAFSDLLRYNAATNQRISIVAYHNTDPNIPFAEVNWFELDHRDRLWMYTDRGLLYWKNSGWNTFYEPSSVLDYPDNVKAGTNGVWIYSSIARKIQYFDGKDTSSWSTPIDVDNGEQIAKTYVDSRNWLWYITNHSRLLCFKGYTWEIYDPALGTLPSFGVNVMLEDSEGDMWFFNGDDTSFRLHIPSGHISGQLSDDENTDCLVQPGEPGTTGYRIVFDNGQQRIETTADQTGKFSVAIPLGNYTTSIVSFNNFGQSCQSGFPVTVLQNDTLTLAIPVQTILLTPQLSVHISTGLTRFCRESTYAVNVCNLGNLGADSAVVTIQLPPGLSFVGSSISSTTDTTGLITFPLGQVGADSCYAFSFVAQVGCQGMVEVGQSLCVTAHVFPDTLPTVGTGNWTGASIQLQGHCASNSVIFEVENVGQTSTQAPLPYQVIQNEYQQESGTLTLAANESKTFEYPADGSTWRFSIEQEAGHPVAPAPSIAVEGCVPGGSGQRSTGFVTQAANATGSAFEEIDCQIVIASSDPNDKRSQPTGWGSRHQIEPGQLLRYNIRFQNTGNDTAFTVIVRDTLDAALDWASFRPALGSHPYRVERDSAHRAIAFIFENILLPDSNRNEVGSHGFVQFSVQSRLSAPLGTTIRNQAAIYFDFNTAVLTNTVLHTIDTGFILPKPQLPVYDPNARISFAPNPAKQQTWLSIELFDPEKNYLLKLYDGKGRLLRSLTMPESPFLLEKAGLPAGVYRAAVWADGKRVAVGQVVFYE